MAVCGLAEVTFDIDRGHSASYVWPPGCLNEEELSDVAFNAFPVRVRAGPNQPVVCL